MDPEIHSHHPFAARSRGETAMDFRLAIRIILVGRGRKGLQETGVKVHQIRRARKV